MLLVGHFGPWTTYRFIRLYRNRFVAEKSAVFGLSGWPHRGRFINARVALSMTPVSAM